MDNQATGQDDVLRPNEQGKKILLYCYLVCRESSIVREESTVSSSVLPRSTEFLLYVLYKQAALLSSTTRVESFCDTVQYSTVLVFLLASFGHEMPLSVRVCGLPLEQSLICSSRHLDWRISTTQCRKNPTNDTIRNLVRTTL